MKFKGLSSYNNLFYYTSERGIPTLNYTLLIVYPFDKFLINFTINQYRENNSGTMIVGPAYQLNYDQFLSGEVYKR